LVLFCRRRGDSDDDGIAADEAYHGRDGMNSDDDMFDDHPRKRGRPKGSLNKPKDPNSATKKAKTPGKKAGGAVAGAGEGASTTPKAAKRKKATYDDEDDFNMDDDDDDVDFPVYSSKKKKKPVDGE
jgi:hypothetical protein